MRRLKLLLASISFLSVMMVSVPASADVNNFTITAFDSEQTLSLADPQGELHIVERITVDFTDNNHGLLRAIPDRYKGHSLQLSIKHVSSESGAPAKYETSSSNGNTVLKIGDPDRTVTGRQQYTIDYTVRNVITFYPDHDELYWDVNGEQWQQPFTRVSLRLHLPSQVVQSADPVCYAGTFGSRSQDCQITRSDNTVTANTTQALGSGQTLTYVTQFKEGAFAPYTWYDNVGEYTKQVISFLVPVVLFGGISIWYWRKYGRDEGRSTGVIIPQYDAPDGLRPIYTGAISDFTVDNRDITATIIDLAVRHYLKIIETKEDRLLLKDTIKYSLELVNPDFTALTEAEVKLMDALFEQRAAGASVELSKSQSALYGAVSDLRSTVKTGLTQSGYFRDRSKTGLAKYLIMYLVGAAFASFLVYLFEHSAATFVGIGVAVVIGFVCIHALDARTAKGVAAKDHLAGLKRYLEVAEKDRLNKLQAPNAAYAPQSTEPIKTVELFEKLLPYAVLLNVEKQWGKQFEGLYTTPPTWYAGNWAAFNAYSFASSVNDGIGSAIGSSFTAPSSGSGSGGFSGGGGGGGGGGGW